MASVDEIACEILSASFGKKELKEEQRLILNALVDKRDCIAVLPTGYGKSLPYQLYVPVMKKLSRPVSRVLVCCPLLSLMQDQVQYLKTIPGLSVAFRGASVDSDKKIADGEIDVIYATPETLVGDPKWRSILQKLAVDIIVIDEFHTIATWGEDSDGSEKQAFRKWFSHIGELRSLFPDASVLALSATCSIKIRKRVMKIMNLKSDTLEIAISPNKPNIKFVLSKVSTSIEMAMSWIVDGMTENFDSFPRTILYCSSINDASNLYEYLDNELHATNHIEMYHSETPDENKEHIIQGLKDPNSQLKLIIATNALGMGVDMVEFHSVVCFGIPDNNLDLIQQIGRVGRDGQPSVALLLYNSYHLSNASREIKDIYKSDECRRVAMMKSFLREKDLDKLKKETGKHSCCDKCAVLCDCKDCTILSLEKMFLSVEGDADSESENDSEQTEEYDLSDYDFESDFSN